MGRKISELVARHTGNNEIEMNLHPVTGLHLAEFPLWQDSEQGSIRYVYLFSVTALFILAIACINFLNLTSARSSVRAREVGIRKAIGGTQKNLRFQFLFESIFLAAANAVALPIGYFLMNRWLQNFAFRADLGWITFVFSGALVILIALGTVSYRSIEASRANPVDSLRHE